MALAVPPGYGTAVPLDRERHRGLGVRPHTAAWSARLGAVYLTVAEFLHAARTLPIAFAREAGGSYLPVLVTGLDAQRNLCIDELGQWRAGLYLPAYVRRYPFCTARTDPDADSYVVCVDETALSAAAEPLFDAAGEPAPAWRRWETLIREMEAARAVTERFTMRLAELDVLEPFEAYVHPQDAPALRLRGLCRVSEDRLNRLSGSAIKDLMAKGQLSRIYAHLASLDNFARLLELHAGPGTGARS